jgi:PIN domain nuclease of toxin-antitoxin system
VKILLDTHTFLWMENDSSRLSPKAAALIRDTENTLILSVVTVWEIQIKVQKGKLTLALPLADIVQNQLQNNQLELLSITLPHVYELDHLPRHHDDPFDRLLIAQAHADNLTLLSKDPQFTQYPVSVIW